jgi:hypothetical protein
MQFSEQSNLMGCKSLPTLCLEVLPLAVPPSSWKATKAELAEKAARNRLCVKLGALARQSIN